jgi:hypothetical protein
MSFGYSTVFPMPIDCSILDSFGLPEEFTLHDLRGVTSHVLFLIITSMEKVLGCTYIEMKYIESSDRINQFKSDFHLMKNLRPALLVATSAVDYMEKHLSRDIDPSLKRILNCYPIISDVINNSYVDELELFEPVARRSTRARKQTEFYYGY